MIKAKVSKKGFIKLEVFKPFLGDKIDLVDSYQFETVTDAENNIQNLILRFFDKDGNILGANNEQSTVP